MKNRLVFFCLFVFLLPEFLNAQTNTHLTQEQKSWLSKANRHKKNGWLYLHIEGAPKERGFQHGYLLAKEIKESIRILSESWKYESALEWQWLVQETGRMFTAKIDTENLTEIDGIVEGMNASGDSTSRDEIVTLNGVIEITGYWWPTVKDTISTNSPEPKKESCSSFIATGNMTADGSIVLGHNTMSGYCSPFFNIILDILPDKGYRVFMQSCAGFIHSGTDFFVTASGLVGSETTISGFLPFDKKGTLEFTRMRHATQYASSIDEWCEIMKKDNNGGYANAWLIGDINTNEIARLELGLKYVGFEKKKDGYFIGSNVAEDLKILRFETKMRETNIKNDCIARRVRWKQLMKEYKGKINLKLAKQFESDHFDTYLNSMKPGGRTLCLHAEIDPQFFSSGIPFDPSGTLDGKVVDSKMAKKMSFLARWGSACGRAFIAKNFLEEHPQFEWMTGLLKDRPTQPWTEFKSGEK
ncbi:MAG: C45 family autoproteolytic acyltransferase/hydrolase [Ignavibacteriales bacterium]|nr:C45 family autoproteolytic acyltransferase/hydrolase [Ignavibacteriales bacterium]